MSKPRSGNKGVGEKKKYVLTRAIDCPWCKAKAGEPCYIEASEDEKERTAYRNIMNRGNTYNPERIHLARCISDNQPSTKAKGQD